MIFQLPRSDHITDARASLHWLRIHFKISVLACKVLTGLHRVTWTVRTSVCPTYRVCVVTVLPSALIAHATVWIQTIHLARIISDFIISLILFYVAIHVCTNQIKIIINKWIVSIQYETCFVNKLMLIRPYDTVLIAPAAILLFNVIKQINCSVVLHEYRHDLRTALTGCVFYINKTVVHVRSPLLRHGTLCQRT